MKFTRLRRRRDSPLTPLWVGAVVGLGLVVVASRISPALGLAVAGLALAVGAGRLKKVFDRLRSQALDIDSALVRRAMSGTRPATDEETRIIRNASHSVRQSVQSTLAVLRASLRAQSALVLWIDSADGVAKVRDAETCSDHLRTGVYDDRGGILGLIRKSNDAAVVNGLSEPELLPWYEPAHAPECVVGVPLRREGMVVGYLVVDRAAASDPFDDVDAVALAAAAEQIALSIHMEFLVLEAATVRRDMEVLDAAAARLNEALTTDDVCREARVLLGRFAPIESFVVTEYDEASQAQEVIYAEGPDTDDLPGLQFGADASIAALVVKRLEALPYNGRLDRVDTPVFGADRPLRGMRSVLVFPITMGQRTVGALCMACSAADAYDRCPRNQIGILVHHIAAALSNALAYSRMVRMATTDGMTGLTNHRTFKERAAEAVARAQRSGRPLSLIMTDIDHFKAVNDTHGHAVGDEVIKGVAGAIRKSHRDVDLTARYGGEEFAILLEDCCIDNAAMLAERLREHVKDLSFEGADATFAVTLSLGVALFSDDMSLGALVECADGALYAAKHAGRNQVVCAEPASAAA